MFAQFLVALTLESAHAENMWTRSQILAAHQNALTHNCRGFIIQR